MPVVTLVDWRRRIEALEARLRKRIPPAFVVNDPEADLGEYRLPDDVVDKLGTIKIGRSDPNDPVEDGREWVARLTAEARCVTKTGA
jgi:hypothetical protein